MPSHRRGPRTLALIAAFKFVKSAALIVLAAALFHLSRPEAAREFGEWISALPVATGHEFVGHAIHTLLGTDSRTMSLFAVVALVYAVLYGIEGFGLWRNARWAEWLTIVSTSLFVPIEIWEIWHRFGAMKVLTLLVNIAIVIYLVRLVRKENATAHPASPG